MRQLVSEWRQSPAVRPWPPQMRTEAPPASGIRDRSVQPGRGADQFARWQAGQPSSRLGPARTSRERVLILLALHVAPAIVCFVLLTTLTRETGPGAPRS